MNKQLIFIYFSVALALISFVMCVLQIIKNPKNPATWTGVLGYGLYSAWGIWVLFF